MVAECARRGLQTLTHLGQLARRDVDALLLDVCTRLLAVRPLENRPKLLRHLLDGVSEIGQLGRDERGVRLLRHLMLSD